jgi:hypothetical protein
MNTSSESLYSRIDKCLCCGSSDLNRVLEYRDSPLTDVYKDSEHASLELKSFPINACLCRQCSHLQLEYQVDPRLSYSDYIYHSSTTQGLPRGFEDYAEYLRTKYPAGSQLTLLDIGSNDGSFLRSCRDLGIRAYGIEPASRLADYSREADLPTACGYFDSEVSQVLEESGFPERYDLVTFNNVLANMANPLEALRLAKSLLANQDSLICVQTGYHPKQFSKGLFDWVYHEHFSYFSLKSISSLAERVGLCIADYSVSELRGGSVRILLSRKNYSHSIDYEYFSEKEHFTGLQIFMRESSRILNSRLNILKEQGYILCGFGASHSTGILVHNFRIANFLEGLYDDNTRKHGLFMPGTNLKVEAPDRLLDIPPDKSACVILAWQYYDNICRRLRSLGYQGKIIKPVLI